MKSWALLILMLFLLGAIAGCTTTDKGSREYIPGKGWVPA